jgi:hypothetical protein
MVNPLLIGQRIYVDASALIYAIETPQAYPGLQTQFLDLFARGELTMVTSWITFAEVLTKPMQNGDAAIEAGYRQYRSDRRTSPRERRTLSSWACPRSGHQRGRRMHVPAGRLGGRLRRCPAGTCAGGYNYARVGRRKYFPLE